MNTLLVTHKRLVMSSILCSILLFSVTSCIPDTYTPVANTPEPDSSSSETQAISVVAVDVTPISGEWVVKTNVASLRSGPSVEFDLVGILTEKGEKVEVNGISPSGEWYRLVDGSWIAANFIASVAGDVVPEATDTSIAITPDQPAPTLTMTTTPTATTTLSPPESPTEESSATPVKIPVATDSSVTCRSTSDVFLLSGPGSASSYNIRGSLTAGSDVQVLGGNMRSGDHTHYKVRAAGGSEGWLFNEYCPLSGDPDLPYLSYPPPNTPTASPTPLPPDTPTPTATLEPSPTLLPPTPPSPRPTWHIPPTTTPGLVEADTPTPQLTSTATTTATPTMTPVSPG